MANNHRRNCSASSVAGETPTETAVRHHLTSLGSKGQTVSSVAEEVGVGNGLAGPQGVKPTITL